MKRRNWHSLFSQLPDAELDKLALLRLLECSNGVIQHQFRDGHEDALSPEETRSAMAFSMRCIKSMEIPLGDDTIRFEGETADLFQDIRTLYVNGMKRNDPEAREEFFIASSANLQAIGLTRLEQAKRRLFNDCYELPVHTLDWGLDYIRGFLTSSRL
ncbi:hypothetical protein ACLM45_00695 [Synechococcus sp. A10-1-5-9]|uniref:hypothetical protein n=1 Tax=Synechococcus sp. A10-1-5-9 TaxID=3392295 RepID=UPI0039E999DD